MKTNPHTLRIVLWVILGLLLSLTSLALNRPQPQVQATATHTPAAQATEAVAEEEFNEDVVGSTDGIMLMAVVIVMVVLVPILVRWRAWAGNGKKSADN